MIIEYSTVKELFATHLALYWMAIKHTVGPLKNKKLGQDEQDKLNFIIKKVKSLVTHKPLLEEIIRVTSNIEGFSTHDYTVKTLEKILDSFDLDNKPSDDTQKLQELQKLY